MQLSAHISAMRFVDGNELELSTDSILVAVGPNNSGKSAMLRSIVAGVKESHPEEIKSPLATFRITRNTPFERILVQLEPLKIPAVNGQEHQYQGLGYGVFTSGAHAWWHSDSPGLGYFARFVISEVGTRTRLTDCDLQASFDVFEPSDLHHPFQRMYRDPQVEAQVSRIVRRAFKKDLILQRAGAQKIPVYVDDMFVRQPGDEQYTAQYVQKLQKLDRLEVQGDGIRSFVSIAARVLTEQRPVQLIDEPEAFLHPPQARLIGEVIAANSQGRQAVIATHSSDVLQGLLLEGAERVVVVRLSRVGSSGRATFLRSDQVAALWSDPILRFSNILDGLFHEGVVLAEGDSDCRFYEAIASVAVPAEKRLDVQYTYSGGKGRLPTVIGALKGLRVPVATIVDFDVLNGEQPLRKIVEAQGGEWSLVKEDWKTLKGFIEGKAAFVSADQYREQVQKLLESCPSGGAVPRETLKEIEKITKAASPWDLAKEKGLHALSPGEPVEVGERLLSKLAGVGVFVAPYGAVEGFYVWAPGKGRRWLEKVLQGDLSHDRRFEQARNFVQAVFEHLGKQASINLPGAELPKDGPTAI